MRYFSKNYTLTSNVFGFSNFATGTNWVLERNSVDDLVGNIVIVISLNANFYPGEFVLLEGLDADGNPQTEEVALPGDGDVSFSLKYFSYLSSATASVSTDTMGLGWTSASSTPTIPIDGNSNSSSAISVYVDQVGVNYTVQETFANIYDAYPSTLPWSNIDGLVDGTISANATATKGVRAIRLIAAPSIDPITVGLILHQASNPTF